MAAVQDKLENMFSDTLSPNPVTSFTLMRGVTDFSNLQQYDLFETGYSFLINLSIPKFLKNAKNLCTEYEKLINNYAHIIEYDFRGLTGIGDIQSDANPLTNGINDLQMITKVNEDGGTQFSMNYYERAGSIITKTHELFLRGIKDPRTQYKRYLGQITGPRQSTNTTANSSDKGYMNASFANEVFNYLLIVTDNTGFNVEKAYILASCQPTTANTSFYAVEKGNINFQEINLNMNGFPITGRIVNNKAVKMLEYINKATCFDEMAYGYSILANENSDIDTIGGVQLGSKIYKDGGIVDQVEARTREY